MILSFATILNLLLHKSNINNVRKMTLNYWKDLHRISLQTASHSLWWRIRPILQMSASTGEMLGKAQEASWRSSTHVKCCCAWYRWCMTRLQMLDIREFFLEAHHESSILHYSPQIACLILVQDSWRDPDTPKQLGLRKVHGLHERSLHLDFLSKMFKTSGYKPLLPRDSHYAWSIFSYSTHLTQWVQTCTYDIVCRSLINISYHNIPHRMPSDRCTWAVWTQQRMILTEICFPFLQVIAKTAKKLRRD